MSAVYNKGFESEEVEKVAISDNESIVIATVKQIEKEREEKLAAEEEKAKERGGWGSKIEFIFAIVGFAVGLGNVWRFPYLCHKHGGGAFLIPYCICMFILAIPIFNLELMLGQRFCKSPLHLWNKLYKPLAGIGIASLITTWFITMYYQMIVGWCFYYLFISFQAHLPYATCPLVSGACNGTDGACNGTAPRYLPECVKASPTTYYWYRVALNTSPNIEVGGTFNWKMFCCLLLASLILYMIVWKGTATLGKVVYFTSTFPYVVLFIFFIRAMTLEGSGDGVIYMFTPQFDKLAQPETWLAAFTQVFYSLGLAYGSIITLASYNDLHNNYVQDGFIVTAVNSFTSIFAGVTIFGILGYKANIRFNQCMEKFSMGLNDTVCDKNALLTNIAQGPGLTFIAFTEAMSTMKFPQLWSVLFFVMILTLGMGTQIGQLEPLRATLCDLKILNVRDEVLTLILSLVTFLIGIIFCQGSGQYWIQMFDSYSANFALLLIVLLYIVVVVYIYGMESVKNDVTLMLGSPPGYYWTLSWRFTIPVVIIILIVASAYQLIRDGMSYEAYNFETGRSMSVQYPAWGVACCILLIFSSIVVIPITFILVKMGLFRFKKHSQQNGVLTMPPKSISQVALSNCEIRDVAAVV